MSSSHRQPGWAPSEGRCDDHLGEPPTLGLVPGLLGSSWPPQIWVPQLLECWQAHGRHSPAAGHPSGTQKAQPLKGPAQGLASPPRPHRQARAGIGIGQAQAAGYSEPGFVPVSCWPPCQPGAGAGADLIWQLWKRVVGTGRGRGMRRPSLLGNKQAWALSELGGGPSLAWAGGLCTPYLLVPPSSHPGPGQLPKTAGISGSPWVTTGVTVAAPGMWMLVVWLWRGVWWSHKSLCPVGSPYLAMPTARPECGTGRLGPRVGQWSRWGHLPG